MKRMAAIALMLSLGFLSVVPAGAQAPAPPPAYGMPISLEQAKKIMVGAEAEAKKNNWPVVIVILDSGGQLVMLQRLDNAQWGSVEIAKEKALPFEPLIPNEETIQAIKAARRGELVTAGSAENLLNSLNEDD